MYQKYFIIFSILFMSLFVKGQKKFEGKYVLEVIYTNIPPETKYMPKNHANTWYYTENKRRMDMLQKIEVGDNVAHSKSSIITDYSSGDQILLMEMDGRKTAILSNINKSNPTPFNYTKTTEFKTILGHKCQKVVNETPDSKFWGYVDFDFKIPYLLDSLNNIIEQPLFFEYESTSVKYGTSTSRITEIFEEPLDVNVFSLDFPPESNFTDNRKIFRNKISVVNADINEYTIKTMSELNKDLNYYLGIENYDAAEKIKLAIQKRKNSASYLYSLKSLSELEIMLKKAVTDEDYISATNIQEEIKKRGK